MILGKSVDKAQIKKISIRVWSLSDEIDATLEQLLLDNQGTIPEDKMQILKSFYEATPLAELSKKPTLTIIQGGKSDQKTSAEAPALQATPQATPQETSVANPVVSPESQVQTQTPAPTPTQDQAPKQELDPFEAAMLAEVEAQKKAQNEASKNAVTDAATLKAQEELQALSIASEGSSLSLAPSANTVSNPSQPVTEKRAIVADDFLKFRKDGTRRCPSEEKLSAGFALLNDIHFDAIMFFTVKPFKPGQDVVIEFDIHKSFTVVATITKITQTSVGSRIITENAPKYRLTASLKHTHLGDRTLIRNFLKSVDATVNPA